MVIILVDSLIWCKVIWIKVCRSSQQDMAFAPWYDVSGIIKWLKAIPGNFSLSLAIRAIF